MHEQTFRPALQPQYTSRYASRNRRLAKNWENLTETLRAFVTLAAIQLCIRRLARRQAFESGSQHCEADMIDRITAAEQQSCEVRATRTDSKRGHV